MNRFDFQDIAKNPVMVPTQKRASPKQKVEENRTIDMGITSNKVTTLSQSQSIGRIGQQWGKKSLTHFLYSNIPSGQKIQWQSHRRIQAWVTSINTVFDCFSFLWFVYYLLTLNVSSLLPILGLYKLQPWSHSSLHDIYPILKMDYPPPFPSLTKCVREFLWTGH